MLALHTYFSYFTHILYLLTLSKQWLFIESEYPKAKRDRHRGSGSGSESRIEHRGSMIGNWNPGVPLCLPYMLIVVTSHTYFTYLSFSDGAFYREWVP